VRADCCAIAIEYRIARPILFNSAFFSAKDLDKPNHDQRHHKQNDAFQCTHPTPGALLVAGYDRGRLAKTGQSAKANTHNMMTFTRGTK
jgi:hypothetical protein